MGYECDAAYWMWFIEELHFTMASVKRPLKSQSGTQAQTPPVDLPWEGILLIPITFHVIGEVCIYNINMVNYSSTTSSLHMLYRLTKEAALTVLREEDKTTLIVRQEATFRQGS